MGPKENKGSDKPSGQTTGPGSSSKKKPSEDILRKLAEEEEARKKSEEEERERKRREAEQLAKDKAVAKEEMKLRRIQLGELEAILDYNKSCVETVETEKRQNSKWQRYLRCDGTPDPTIPSEINTYINLLLEEPSASVNDAFEQCKVLLALVEELNFIITDTPPDHISPDTLEQYKTTLARLECLIQYKLDQATYEELLHASENLNPETANLERILCSENLVSLCIWGNLIKNPRIRSHEFPDIGFTFEIPKPIGNSSVAVRVMHTTFDHCSRLTRTFYPKLRIPERKREIDSFDVIKLQLELLRLMVPEVTEEEKAALAATATSEAGIAATASTEKAPTTGEQKEEQKEDQDEDILAQLDFLDKPKTAKDEKKPEEEVEESEYDAAPTPPPEDYEDYEELIDVVDLRQNQPVGGIFHINLLQLPPQPKTVKNWTLRLMQTPAQLHFVDYVATTTHYYPVAISLAGPMAQTLNFALGFTNMQHTLGSAAAAGVTLSEGGQDKANETENKDKETRPPVPVVMKLPTNVMFFESPQVARWHDDRKCWVSDAVTNLQYKEDQRLLSFRLERFGVFTLVQDRHINMPFQSWEMWPLATGHVRFHIIAAIAEVEIEIAEDQCALVKPDDKSELQHLIGQFMSLDKFIDALKNAGINLFPEPDSYKFVGIQNKNQFIEKRIYQHMALVSSGLAFSWSKWNADCNDNQRFLIQAVGWEKPEAPTEDDWKLIQIQRRRAVQLVMNEFADAFRDDRIEDSPYFATIFHLAKHLSGGSDSPGWNRVVDTSYRSVLTVGRFLAATRLLVYS